MIAGLQNQWQQEQFRAQQDRQKPLQQSFARCWGVLGQKGIDKPKLQHILKRCPRTTDFARSFATLNDPAVVMVMKDAGGLSGAAKEKD